MAQTARPAAPGRSRSVRSWGPFALVAAAVTAYYEIGNRLFAPSFEVAHLHSVSLWRWEQALHLDWELAVQQAVQHITIAGRPLLMDFLALVYVGPHFLLTLGLFVWAYVWRRDRLAEVRNVFAAFTVLAFGFQWLYPVAPPWQTPETGIAYGLTNLPVDGSDPTIASLTNPLAAFPSVHTGWAFLCAWFFVTLWASPRRHLWWAYPATIILTIVATGNHFIIDILAAIPFLAAAFVVDAWLRKPHPEPFSTRRGDFSPPSTLVHGPADAALWERWQGLTRVPAHPRRLGWVRNLWSALRLGQDYLLSVPPGLARVSAPLRRYPAPFRRETITTTDGTRLAAWVGLQPRKAPALVIVPGLFTSKDNHVVRRRAIRVFRQWGYHVLTVDMRGNGQSDRVPTTCGWKEAEDLLDAVRHLRSIAAVDGVAIYGESLAGTAVAIAARLAGERGEPFADLGAIAASALHDPGETIRAYSTPGGEGHAFTRFFTFLLRRSGQRGIRTFREYHEAGSRRYGRDPTEAAAAAAPVQPGMRLTGPLLLVHSSDDELAPVAHLESRLATVRQTRHLAAWILPWGHHCLHELSDGDWFWTVLEGFVGPRRQTIRQAVGTRTVEALAQQA